MSTYDHKQVLADYANDRITPEMATGHSLQHIDKLYELLKAQRQEWHAKIATLDTRVSLLQTAVERVTAVIERLRSKPKPNAATAPPKAES